MVMTETIRLGLGRRYAPDEAVEEGRWCPEPIT